MKKTTIWLLKTGLGGLLSLLIAVSAGAETQPVCPPVSTRSIAFARYIASLQERDAFTESGPVAVEIDASLPGLYKETRFLAIRDVGESERSTYAVLQIDGDAIVAQELIARYLLLQEELEELPLAAVAITPANYKFRYKGEVGAGSALTYIYDITPKQKRAGLVEGQLWIDSETGSAILQSGRFVSAPPAFHGQIELVSETTLRDGSPVMRVTHMRLETAQAGRGELKITEIPLGVEKNQQYLPQPGPVSHQ